MGSWPVKRFRHQLLLPSTWGNQKPSEIPLLSLYLPYQYDNTLQIKIFALLYITTQFEAQTYSEENDFQPSKPQQLKNKEVVATHSVMLLF